MKTALLFGTFFVLVASSSAEAASYNYKCFSYYWNGYEGEKGTMKLSLNSKSARADILEESWDDDLGGSIDTKYRSRGSVKYVKFGANLIVEEALLEGGKELRDGSLGGFARVEGQAEGGFFQYKFICKR